LLRQQVDIDKENSELVDVEISTLKTQIKRAKQEQDQMLKMFELQAEQISTYSKKLPASDRTLTAANLAKLGVGGGTTGLLQDDVMSEFSVLTEESNIGPSENVLDLRISDIQFDHQMLKELLGLSADSKENLRTFATFEFYNNQIVHTDLKPGFNPQFDTIFCFKNVVDNFYLKYLEKESIKAEIFVVKESGNS